MPLTPGWLSGKEKAARPGKATTVEGLTIGGVTPLSPLDYPDALATMIYCPGDPWGCPFSQARPEAGGAFDPAAVLSWLESRRGQVDAVLFSGGEPTLLAGMAETLAAARDLGFLTGIHTTGLFPEALASVLPACDWVGLAVMAPRAAYARLTGDADSGAAVFASLAMLLRGAVPFEIRTTWHPGLLDEESLTVLAGELATAGAIRWSLQIFRPGPAPEGGDVPPPAFPALLVSRLQAAAPRLTIDVRT